MLLASKYPEVQVIPQEMLQSSDKIALNILGNDIKDRDYTNILIKTEVLSRKNINLIPLDVNLSDEVLADIKEKVKKKTTLSSVAYINLHVNMYYNGNGVLHVYLITIIKHNGEVMYLVDLPESVYRMYNKNIIKQMVQRYRFN